MCSMRFVALIIASIVFLGNSSFLFSQPSQWSSRGVGGGGALYLPSWSPHNPNELFLACDMTPLFRTTNLGQTWTTQPFQQNQATNNRGHVQFTNNPSLVYTVDASVINGSDVYRAKKSTDGGTSWSYLASDPTSDETYSLFADFNQPNRLIISSYNRLYISTDGGASFAQRFSTTAGSGLHVAGALFDGANIYVGTNQGVLRSTDNGASFSVMSLTAIPAAQAIVSFAGAKQGSTTRFFCVTLDAGDVYAGVVAYETQAYQGVYSVDVGQTAWTLKTSGVASAARPYFVAMSPSNIDVAYIGGGSTNGTPMIFKTTNAGTSWTSVLQTTNNQSITTGWSGHQGDRDWSFGEFVLGLAVAPNDVNRVAFTDLGFAHATTDGGATWRQLYVDPSTQNAASAPTPKNRTYRSIGLENTSCWHVAWADASTVIASFTDIRGIRSEDAGQTWSFNYTGHTLNSMYYCLKHPVSGTLYAATSSVHDLYQSTYLTDSRIDGGTGRILFSTDKGRTWQQMTGYMANKPVIWLAADPTNPNRLYASVVHSSLGGIYVSNNINAGASATWTKLANPPRTEGHPLNIHVLNDGSLVCTYSGRRAPGFTASSGVFYSTDGGASWLDRSDLGMQYWTKDITIDPHDPTQNTWYVGVFSGFGGPANDKGGVYKSTNRGQSWTRINSLHRVTACAINPAVANEAYITTEGDGLWYSSNIAAASPQITRVASYPFRQPERVLFNPFQSSEVWVTSFGNGLKVGTGTTGQPPPPPVASAVYSTKSFPEAAANDGTITSTATITLSGETWATNIANGTPLTLGTHYTVANVPNGLTLVVTKTSASVVTVSFTGTAQAHAQANSVGNVTLTLLNAAVVSGNVAAVVGLQPASLSISFADPVIAPTATYSAKLFPEVTTNNGAITSSATITLAGDTWASSIQNGSPLSASIHYTATNVPVGLTLVLIKTSANVVTLSFTGAALAHAQANNVQNLTLTFLNAAVTSAAATSVAGLSPVALSISFANPVVATYSTKSFPEAAANNGTITSTATITLSGDAWTAGVANGSALASGVHYTATNVPSGLTLVLTKTSSTVATISFIGAAQAHAQSNSVQSVAISFFNTAVTSGNSGSIVGLQAPLSITFNDPPPVITPTITSFTPTSASTGTVVTITGMNLGGASSVQFGGVAASSFTVVSPTQITAVVGAGASGSVAVVTANGMASVPGFTFIAPIPRTATYSTGRFLESAANNGTITSTATITLAGDTWTPTVANGSPFTLGTHYTTANVPNGLTLVVTKTSPTVATLHFAGAALAHAQVNSVQNIGVTFLNSAVNSGNSSSVNNLNTTLAMTFSDPVSTSIRTNAPHKQYYLSHGQDVITLELPSSAVKPSVVDVRIFDATGRTIMTRTEKTSAPFLSYSIVEMPSGYYMVEVIVNGSQRQTYSFLRLR